MPRAARVDVCRLTKWTESRTVVLLGTILAALCLFPAPVRGQTPVDRITRPIDDNVRVRRSGSRHPLARPEFEAGRVPGDTRMERIILVLQPDAAQQGQLEQLLAAQQDINAPQYHQWLTPEEFGRQFGVSDHDLNQVVRWLQDQGFELEPPDQSRRRIVFSGTVRQVEAAFRTEIHAYRVNGAVHHANASDLEIPAALAPVISGVLSLHDFRTRPMHARMLPAESAPQYTGSSGSHDVAPGDFAAIYDVAPLYGSSTNGSGQSIAVVARSNLKLADVESFRSNFGLPAKDPEIIVNGSDPGVVSSDEQGEVTLDTEWAGAVAPNALIQVVVSASTGGTDGVALSAQYIVNHDLAPVVSASFGVCESAMGHSGNQFWNALWQQAAAQGMTVLVASGDSGAAGCDAPTASTGTIADVNGLCSSPYATCVGGTELNDQTNPAAYWFSTNTSSRASATGYIPEVAWNESATAGGTALWASGGGPSQVYSKPGWQSGRGVPADGHRDTPDVALAGAAHDSYLFYMNAGYYTASGTSLGPPSFAGLVALIDGRQGARQGNINPTLYTLAANQAHGGSAVFHDITSGNNNVPGVTGHAAGTGYDLVTGLGSVDANLLVNAWNNGNTPPPQCTYSLSALSAAVPAGGQDLAVGLTASSSTCAWSVSSDSGWIAITGGTSLTGSQTVTYTVAPNPSSVPRTGTLTVAGLPFTVSQDGAPCTYAVSPGSLTSTADGFNGAVSVVAPDGCTWTAASEAPWIAVTAGATGTGSGAVTLVAAPNTGARRSGAVVVAGSTLTVTEAPRGDLGIARPAAPKTTPE